MLGTVLNRTMRPVGIGVVVGLAGAAAAIRLLSSSLEVLGVSSGDPIGVAGAALFVLAIALVASLIPARRGLSVDPIATLRYE